jgi:enamine deaminase RidA (YjgF/YER057c/UK114 family)
MIARISSGGPWEATIGYSRAVVAGGFVLVSGCTATVDGQVTHVGDAGGQLIEALGIALDALAIAGASVDQVVRTRMYVVNPADADAVGAAHGRIFSGVRPAATMVFVAGLIHPDHLIEVEVEAYIGGEIAPNR